MTFDPTVVTPAALPSVPLAERKSLPPCQGIYFVLAGDERVLYIGRAKNLRSRWAMHHRLKDVTANGASSIHWLAFDGSSELLDGIEKACIEYFAPALNGVIVDRHETRAGKISRTVMLPTELVARLEQIADEEYRTYSQQLEVFLERALTLYEREQAK